MRALLAFMLAPLAACQTAAEIGRAPAVTPPDLPAPLAPAYAPPVHLAAHPPAPAAPGSLWSPRSHPLHAGTRARAVGDLVTVLVAIDDEGSFRNSTNRRRSGRSGRDLTLGAEWGGVAGPTGTADVSFGGRTDHAGDGRTRRGERVFLRVAAHVEAVTVNGDLHVRGTQEVLLNHELRRLEVAGTVRRRDIGPANEVALDRMAGARVAYGGRGRLSEVQQPPVGQQIVDVVSPL